MAVVDVINCKGEKVSERELNDTVFNVSVKPEILHKVIRMQLNRKRSGTAKVKFRSDVKGSGRKLFRQKGTGRARRGNIKSPLLRGGGAVFGPRQRSYEIDVQKKVRRLAMKMALSSKLKENSLMVIDSIELEEIKTKSFVEILKSLKIDNALFIIEEDNVNLQMSARNLPDINVMKPDGLNVYDILKYNHLIMLEPSINQIEGRLC